MRVASLPKLGESRVNAGLPRAGLSVDRLARVPQPGPMHLRLVPIFALVLAACGDDTSDGSTGTTGSTATDTASSGTSEGSSGGSTGTMSSDTSSSGGTSGTDATTGSTGADTTDGGSTTGEVGTFERFRLDSAAGPCPPEQDCDGFIELVADGTLRVETFGDVEDTVVEAAVSDEDLAAAVDVFSDPALLALLDGPDPACEPPSDIFEMMTVVVDGVTHDGGTTFCDQAPIAAARETALGLAQTYAP